MIAILLTDIVHSLGITFTFCLFPFGDWCNPLSQTRLNLQVLGTEARQHCTVKPASYARLTGANSVGVGEGGEREKKLCRDQTYRFQA